jgi:predicted RNA-binding Zn ribbon-like protein
MPGMGRRQAGVTEAANPFDWSGGHPALDFVNTLDERPLPQPIEHLGGYPELVRFAELAGLITPKQAGRLRKRRGPGIEQIAGDARKLREELFAVLTAAHRREKLPRLQLRGLTAAISRAHAARMLAGSNGPGITGYDWASPDAAEVLLHASALAIADLLTGEDRKRIRKCGASDCAVYFIDRSKGHRRHWCSMANCGNREKQRRWRAQES